MQIKIETRAPVVVPVYHPKVITIVVENEAEERGLRHLPCCRVEDNCSNGQDVRDVLDKLIDAVTVAKFRM
jgi:hypothetical protein